MLDYVTAVSWSPYFAGAGIGILACGAFLLSDHPLGCSTGYVKIRGLLERAVRPAMVEKNEYYRVIPPAFDWQFFYRAGHHHRRICVRDALRVVPVRLGACTLGGHVRSRPRAQDRRCGYRGDPARNGGPVGRRVHERARDIRHAAALLCKHRCCGVFLCRGIAMAVFLFRIIGS